MVNKIATATGPIDDRCSSRRIVSSSSSLQSCFCDIYNCCKRHNNNNNSNNDRNDYNVIPDIDERVANENDSNDITNDIDYGLDKNSSPTTITGRTLDCYTRFVRHLYRHRTIWFTWTVTGILLVLLPIIVTKHGYNVWMNVPNYYYYSNTINTNGTNIGDLPIAPPVPPHHHKELVPSLLSLIDVQTNDFVYALDNPIYDQLKISTIGTTITTPTVILQKKTKTNTIRHHHHRHPRRSVADLFESDDEYIHDIENGSIDIDIQYPTIHISKGILFQSNTVVNEDLLISWTTGIDENGNDIIKDDDLVLLHCTRTSIAELDMNNNTTTTPPMTEQAMYDWDLLEAATIKQIKVTASLSNDTTTTEQHENSWYIPNFPRLRYSVCKFSLYQSSTASTSTSSDNTSNTSSLPSSYRYDLVAVSELLVIQNAMNVPTAIHLAIGTDPSIMVINFVTGIVGTPVVEYWLGSTLNNYHHDDTVQQQYVTGTSDTYTSDELCQQPANLTELGKFMSPGNLHTVTITGLVPNTKYNYRVGIKSQQGIVWRDEIYTFTSTVPIGWNDEPVSFLIYGDQGCPSSGWGDGALYVSTMTAREIINVYSNNNNTTIPIRSIHHIGDLSYAQGAAHQWDIWFTMIEAFTPYVPLMIGVGNHEYDHTAGGSNGKDPSGLSTDSGFMPDWGNFADDSGGECGVPTSKRFTMPQQYGNTTSTNNTSILPSSNGVYWYSYDVGIVHTIVVSSEHDLSAGSIQHKWLEHDMKNVNRSITPWLIVETHRPLYEGEDVWASNEVGIHMRYEFEDLLYNYNVDLVFAGHYHAYHRTCDRLYRGICGNNNNNNNNNKGPMHLTIGTAGAHLDDSDLFDNNWTEKFIRGTFGYGRVTVINSTVLHFEFVQASNNYNIDSTTPGIVLDDVWIIRER